MALVSSVPLPAEGLAESAVDFRELRNHGKYEVYTSKCALWFFKSMPLLGGISLW